MGRGRAKQAARALEAIGTRHKDVLADRERAGRVGRNHASDRLVAGNERVAHAGKRRHCSGVEQPFGAGADRTPFERHNSVAGLFGLQRELAQCDLPGLCKGDG